MGAPAKKTIWTKGKRGYPVKDYDLELREDIETLRKELPGADEMEIQRMAELNLRRQRAFKDHMSPPGALNLPEPVEAARVKHLIPDEAWEFQPAFTRIIVWQTAQTEGRKMTSSGIELAQISSDAERFESPVGILIGAGISALDQLYSHGICLGDTIFAMEVVPYRRKFLIGGSVHASVMSMRAGDVAGSKELADRLRAGEARLVAVPENPDDPRSAYIHCFLDKEGREIEVQNPHIPKDK